jgi:hypothetical protein
MWNGVLVLKWRLDGLALGRSGPKYRPCYSFCTGLCPRFTMICIFKLHLRAPVGAGVGE